MKKIEIFTSPQILNNTYLLVNGRQAVIIDPSFSTGKLKDYIEQHQLQVAAILLTHGHYDHFASVDELGNLYHCPYYISGEDEEFLYDKRKSHALQLPGLKPLLYEGGVLNIGDFVFNLIEVPGHSPGSVIIIWEDNMFTGDFLFSEDIGRTDLYGGSPKAMEDSLRKTAGITGDYNLFPGHEETSTLAKEKQHNPYLNRYV